MAYIWDTSENATVKVKVAVNSKGEIESNPPEEDEIKQTKTLSFSYVDGTKTPTQLLGQDTAAENQPFGVIYALVTYIVGIQMHISTAEKTITVKAEVN